MTLHALRARLRSLWEGVFRRRESDAELRDEFQLHMELRAADLVKAGMAPDEAERVARAEFGGVFDRTQAVREARGLGWLDALRFSALDFKLGARMLRRYPGLTIIASLSMGVAIAIGAAVLSVLTLLSDPKLPLPEGERIVSMRLWNTRTWAPEYRIVHEFAQWRSELKTVRDVTAFRGAMRNIIAPDGTFEPTRAVSMTASGFRVAGVAPHLGRYLLEGDEEPGAKLVAVLGYDVWQSRFGGDTGIVGREVMLGAAMHTIVGVMPEGFHFPIHYSLWVPFVLDPLKHRPHEGPIISAFGRLAPGATVEAARAELGALADRNNLQAHESEATLKASVVPYAQSWVDLDTPDGQLGMQTARLLVVLLLTLISVNIAILVYARTATRQREIAVRTALGASRVRIVTQLFGESLLLASVGAVIGLGIVGVIAANIEATLPLMGVTGLPYWLRFDISGATVRHVVLLAVSAAAMIGILPALQVTGRRVQRSLQHFAGGQASVRMGKTWTALIVIEVAITVAVLPTTLFIAGTWVRSAFSQPGFAAGEVLSASVTMERDFQDEAPSTSENLAFFARYFAARDELLRRVRADDRVRAATFAQDAAGSESYNRWDLDTAGLALARVNRHDLKGGRLPTPPDPFAAELAVRARWAVVEIDYMKALDIPLIAGRSFGPADADSMATTVLVNRSFVESNLQGHNAVGRRLRTIVFGRGREVHYGPWMQIVGVVGDFPNIVDLDRPSAAVYQASNSRRMFPVTLHVRTVAPDATAYADRLRATAVAVLPALQLREVLPMDDVIRNQGLPLKLVALGLIIVTMSVVILSAAGIYSLMSVVVTQRRREIGIRIALGADRRHVLSGVFKRTAGQVSVGIAFGIAIAGPVRAYGGSPLTVLPIVAVLAMVIGVMAALGPARQALSIQPTEVLKDA
jgi:putative ABC transport system permease protein